MSTPVEQERRRPLSLPLKIFLFVGLPLLFVAMLAAAVFAAVPLLAGNSVDRDYSAPAASTVQVSVPNARMDFTADQGDEVVVKLTGNYTGPEPRLRVETTGDETRIEGGCEDRWFTICSIRIQVTLPAGSDLSVQGTNGAITAQGLDGSVVLGTTNGRIELSRIAGPVTATTTNGAISLLGGEADRVTARTTNGAVDLDFATAPTTVQAQSTNGGIRIGVPNDGTSYYVDASTTNGTVGGDVESDRGADRTITARTTNGTITVDRTR